MYERQKWGFAISNFNSDFTVQVNCSICEMETVIFKFQFRFHNSSELPYVCETWTNRNCRVLLPTCKLENTKFRFQACIWCYTNVFEADELDSDKVCIRKICMRRNPYF